MFAPQIMTDERNPLYVLKLWYKPGQTMQGLIQSGRGHSAALLIAAVFGLVQGARFYLTADGAGLEYYLVGAVAGVTGLFLFSFLLRNFGRWFGGRAALKSVRIALGHALLPWTVLFGALVWALQAIDAAVVVQYYWLFFIGFVYGYVVLLLSLASALGISALKMFLCLIVTALVSLFPLTMLIQLLAPGLVPSQ